LGSRLENRGRLLKAEHIDLAEKEHREVVWAAEVRLADIARHILDRETRGAGLLACVPNRGRREVDAADVMPEARESLCIKPGSTSEVKHTLRLRAEEFCHDPGDLRVDRRATTARSDKIFWDEPMMMLAPSASSASIR